MKSGALYSDGKLLSIFAQRNQVHTEVKKYLTLKPEIWNKVEYYYRLRCKLVHERVTVGVNDNDIEDFREVVERLLRKLYNLRFS